MNYYQARGWPRVSASETRTPLEQLMVRMRELGARPDELEAAAAVWGINPEEDARITTMPDHELRADILAVRTEYETGTTSEADATEQSMVVDYLHTMNEARQRVGGTIPSIMAWVADDPIRAFAVADLETSDEGAGRSTLLRQLDKIAAVDDTADRLTVALEGV